MVIYSGQYGDKNSDEIEYHIYVKIRYWNECLQ